MQISVTFLSFELFRRECDRSIEMVLRLHLAKSMALEGRDHFAFEVYLTP